MGNSWKIVLVLLLVGGAVLAAVYFFSGTENSNNDFSQAETPRKLEVVDTQNTPGPDVVTNGPTAAPAVVGTEKVAAGKFQSVIGGELNYASGITLLKVPLTSEVSIMCTKQNLSGITQIDFNSVTDIKIVKPSEVASSIDVSQDMVVFSEYADGVLTANTLVVDAATCE